MSIAVDDHLLIAAQRGDMVALERVIAQCRPNLRRYASRYCVTTSDAEEAVQESLIILYRRLPALRSVGAFSGWLFQVIQHECQLLARKMFHQHVPLDAAIEDRYLTTCTDIELRLAARDGEDPHSPGAAAHPGTSFNVNIREKQYVSDETALDPSGAWSHRRGLSHRGLFARGQPSRCGAAAWRQCAGCLPWLPDMLACRTVRGDSYEKA